MTKPQKKKYDTRIIQSTATMLEALKQMDRIDHKLLLVFSKDIYVGLLSIGDIQRAMLSKLPMETEVHKVIRKEITCAYSDEAFEEIRQRMLHHRTEIMPVLNSEGELVDVYFWEEVFERDMQGLKRQLNLPVVIMAGGAGTRLKPLTNVLPKPLIPIGERTIIETIMDRFGEYGCNEFHISINHQADMIKYYLREQAKKSYQMSFFEENQPLGTAGSLHLLKSKIRSPFFVSNCDILIDMDYADIYDYHRENGNDLTIVSAIKNFPIIYGTLETGPNGQLEKIMEKPEFTIQINTGMYLLDPKVIEFIPENQFFHITDLINYLIANHGRVGVFPVNSGSWMNMAVRKTTQLTQRAETSH